MTRALLAAVLITLAACKSGGGSRGTRNSSQFLLASPSSLCYLFLTTQEA